MSEFNELWSDEHNRYFVVKCKSKALADAFVAHDLCAVRKRYEGTLFRHFVDCDHLVLFVACLETK